MKMRITKIKHKSAVIFLVLFSLMTINILAEDPEPGSRCYDAYQRCVMDALDNMPIIELAILYIDVVCIPGYAFCVKYINL